MVWTAVAPASLHLISWALMINLGQPPKYLAELSLVFFEALFKLSKGSGNAPGHVFAE